MKYRKQRQTSLVAAPLVAALLVLACYGGGLNVAVGQDPAEKGPAKKGAAAPNYQEMSIHKDLADEAGKPSDKARRFFRVVNSIRKDDSKSFDAKRKKIIDRWYKQGQLAKMTLLENVSRLPELRKELLYDHNKFARSQGRVLPIVHAYVNDLTLKTFTPIVEGNYHPAVKHNAMMVLVNLKAKDLGRVKSPLFVPYMDTHKLMGEAAKNSRLNFNFSPEVRVAAMAGVVFHARDIALLKKTGHLGEVNNAALGLLRTTSLVILKAKTPKKGISADGNAWMRMRAAEALGYLITVDTAQADTIFAALATVVGETDTKLSVRCAAAKALANAPKVKSPGVPAKELAGSLGQLAVEASEHPLLASDDPADNILVARLICHRAKSVQAGLNGTKAALGSNATIVKVSKGVDGIVALFAEAVPEDLAGEVEPLSRNLKSALKNDGLWKEAAAATPVADATATP